LIFILKTPSITSEAQRIKSCWNRGS